ncbi:MAG: serine/threonine-protein kinase [Pirellulaceae bacterium]|nr:serine/threonine-protein kinase [Pirellulaceae bacterium]
MTANAMPVNPGESILRSSALVSGLVSTEKLDYALRVARHRLTQQGLPPDAVISDSLLAEILVEQKTLTTYQAEQMLIGRTKFNVGPYWITDFIGEGGMGQVFKAEHQVMGRVCAVKVLPGARATDQSRESFAREIRMQATLDYPYLVRAFDAGRDGKVHYLVTEYVPGMDLRRLVKSRGPLPVQQAAKIIMHAALGLDYAHRKGLVHRDVKPGNILVTPEGDAKVSDVGLAGFAHDLMNDPRAGKIVGTTDYLSPEQIRTPLEIKPSSDIYSLGCTLYYAVCGKVPFPGGDTASKLRRHIDETPWHPRKFAPDITEEFVDIIADMMEKDPRKRIASAAEVAARLEPWAVESVGVGAMSAMRSPWMSPPPPLNEDEKAESRGEEPSGLNDSWADATPGRDQSTDGEQPSRTIADRSMSLSGSASSFGDVAPPSQAAPNSMTTSMVVALTVAICLPPALLAGAILGYLVAQR